MNEFINFYNSRRKRPENIGRSFTHGSAFYDYMKQKPWIYRSEEREQIERAVQSQYWLTQEQTNQMSYWALLELCDLSILDEIANHLYFNDEEND